MIFSELFKEMSLKTVLIAPLDWGLGHGTRCIPIIRELEIYQFNIIIAADGPLKTLLQQEFPHLTFIPLFGYNIQYSKTRRWFNFKLLAQAPQILFTIYKEHNWLKKVVKEYSINVVISDNRFGLFHSSITSVYITHQLNIKTGQRFSDIISSKIHTRFIKKYSQCWVADFEGTANVAGMLSHSPVLPHNIKYLGCLSRFEKLPLLNKTKNLLIILSGPEPQRTIFENVLLSQLLHYKGTVVFVRGLPDNPNNQQPDSGSFNNANIIFKNHLPAEELNKAIQQASLVISRSGYTTIMDLLKLSQRAILVPTPGQAEQEYLATYLASQKYFYSVTQENFNLLNDTNEASKFSFVAPIFDMNHYKKIIQQFVHAL